MGDVALGPHLSYTGQTCLLPYLVLIRDGGDTCRLRIRRTSVANTQKALKCYNWFGFFRLSPRAIARKEVALSHFSTGALGCGSGVRHERAQSQSRNRRRSSKA